MIGFHSVVYIAVHLRFGSIWYIHLYTRKCSTHMHFFLGGGITYNPISITVVLVYTQVGGCLLLRAVPSTDGPCEPRAPIQSTWGAGLGVPSALEVSRPPFRLGSLSFKTIRPNAGPCRDVGACYPLTSLHLSYCICHVTFAGVTRPHACHQIALRRHRARRHRAHRHRTQWLHSPHTSAPHSLAPVSRTPFLEPNGIARNLSFGPVARTAHIRHIAQACRSDPLLGPHIARSFLSHHMLCE